MPFQLGDHVGVGCMVDSCMKCAGCKKGNENLLLGESRSHAQLLLAATAKSSERTHAARVLYLHRVLRSGLSTLPVLGAGAASRTRLHIRGRTCKNMQIQVGYVQQVGLRPDGWPCALHLPGPARPSCNVSNWWSHHGRLLHQNGGAGPGFDISM